MQLSFVQCNCIPIPGSEQLPCATILSPFHPPAGPRELGLECSLSFLYAVTPPCVYRSHVLAGLSLYCVVLSDFYVYINPVVLLS